MTQRKRAILQNAKGTSAVEFALTAPVLFTFIIGVAQLGQLYFANAGLKSAVAEGARLATIHPRPTNSAILARITDKRVGLDPAYITAPTIASGQQNGRDYLDISMGYEVPLDFIFFETGPVRLREDRRVFVHAAGGGPPTPATTPTPSPSPTATPTPSPTPTPTPEPTPTPTPTPTPAPTPTPTPTPTPSCNHNNEKKC